VSSSVGQRTTSGHVKILILGGTQFVGRHFVEVALERGHELTLFNRGISGPDLFPEAEQLRGDRTVDLSPLAGRTWDLVFDASCYVVRAAQMAVAALAGNVGRYAFVSSLSVYADQNAPDLDESAPVGRIDDPTMEVVDGDTYGPLKALCEQEVLRPFPDALVLRCGFIVGPYDDVDRLPWWIRRIADGGEVLAPDRPDYPAQLIDARDIAEWTLAMIERGEGGVFNVTAPLRPYGLGEVLETCKRVSGSDAWFTWVPEAFLLDQGMDPDDEPLPYWLGPAYLGGATSDVRKAIGAGLTSRPLEATIADTYAWERARPREPLRVGIASDRERAILEAWRASRR
jgi:2'-hydroxyisoflavone reductase